MSYDLDRFLDNKWCYVNTTLCSKGTCTNLAELLDICNTTSVHTTSEQIACQTEQMCGPQNVVM
jgi:hypothetical protein